MLKFYNNYSKVSFCIEGTGKNENWSKLPSLLQFDLTKTLTMKNLTFFIDKYSIELLTNQIFTKQKQTKMLLFNKRAK